MMKTLSTRAHIKQKLVKANPDAKVGARPGRKVGSMLEPCVCNKAL